MNMRVKLFTSFLVMAVLLAAAGVVSLALLKSQGDSVASMLDQNYRSIEACDQMAEGLERADSGVLILIGGQAKEGEAILKEADEKLGNAFNVARNNITVPGEDRLVAQVDERLAAYRRNWAPPAPAEPAERRMQWYFAASHPAFLEAKHAVARLRSLNATAMYGTASSLQSRARHALVPSVVAIAAAFLLTVLFTYLIDLFVIAPIRRLTAAVRGVKDSETLADADLASRDEVWELQEAVRDALAKRDRTGDEP